MMKIFDGCLRSILDSIRHGDYPGYNVIHRNQHHCLGLSLKSLHNLFKPVNRELEGIHHANITYHNRVTIHFCRYPQSNFSLKTGQIA